MQILFGVSSNQKEKIGSLMICFFVVGQNQITRTNWIETKRLAGCLAPKTCPVKIFTINGWFIFVYTSTMLKYHLRRVFEGLCAASMFAVRMQMLLLLAMVLLLLLLSLPLTLLLWLLPDYGQRHTANTISSFRFFVGLVWFGRACLA